MIPYIVSEMQLLAQNIIVGNLLEVNPVPRDNKQINKFTKSK